MSQVGKRFRLTEDEGRRLFCEHLPLRGSVTKKYKNIGLENGWLLLKLDHPFDYQVENKTEKRFIGFSVSQIAIRSRWAGHDIGGSQPTSVFVLIADSEEKFNTDIIDPKDFYFESWAMCHNEK
ncbi:MAG TPA: hypothetical protein VL357_09715 [Rariglobus sp.]|jgi:hypothetical protein|nr:hypothetical protein [Rariglobus sp.]